MTENPKLEENMGCDNLGSNCGELGEKGISVCDEVNGLQHSTTKSDSFVVDMERFSHIIDKDLNSNSRTSRNLSRKGSARTGEKKLTANDRDTNLLATSPRATLHGGGSTPEKPAVGSTDHSNMIPQLHHNHHQITISNGTVSTGPVVAETKLGGKRFSFRRSAHPTWIIDPRRILFIFATLSCMGTILLIYFTLSMGGKPNGDDNAVN